MSETNKSQDKLNQIKTSLADLNTLLENEHKSKNEEIKKLEKKKQELLNVTKVLDVSLLPDVINLNVGGMKYQTTKAILTKIPGTYFHVMLSGELDIKPMAHKPNTYFIDRDGTLFRYVLNYFRDGEEKLNIPNEFRNQVETEFLYYGIKIKDQIKIEEEKPQKISTIIDQSLFKTINSWIDPNNTISFDLLYQGSLNAFTGQSFHSACDGRGPTITLIQTTDGCVFGGYNSQSWNSNGKLYGDDKCFIFTLVNKHGIKPTKYLPHPSKGFVYCNSSTGPCFGYNDIDIRGQKATQSFPDAYIDSTGKGKLTLTGSEKFMIQDYEVYQCLED
ncbi:hypothetical protein CYY_002970 [Polysphondylium violaceum]|uniref:TLDc domain-containing protein n=1 Tax=Polysphondylium violaceum TaxID=133409 RepID=A0A8J4PZ89_9MYCE|nr:hypothetical protein CYY_002970 [Polysphondylium violaceum]